MIQLFDKPSEDIHRVIQLNEVKEFRTYKDCNCSEDNREILFDDGTYRITRCRCNGYVRIEPDFKVYENLELALQGTNFPRYYQEAISEGLEDLFERMHRYKLLHATLKGLML